MPVRPHSSAAVRLASSYWPKDESKQVIDLTIGDLLRGAAADAPDGLALVAGMPDPAARRRWTFAELLADSERAARALAALFQPGERVAVWAPNLPEWIILEMAAGLAGVILVTVNPAYRPAELLHVLSQSGASGIFHVPEFRGNPMAASLEQVMPELPALRHIVSFDDWDEFIASGRDDQALPHVSPDDPALLLYTSGTTGFPKGALLNHRGIVNSARFTVEKVELRPGDAWLSPTPLFHTGGCVVVALGTLWARATHIPILMFDPGLALELIETEKVGFMGGVPTVLLAMMEHPDRQTRDMSSLMSVLSGGANVPPELVRRIESALDLRFGIAFGQTETSSGLSQTRLDDTPEDKGQTVGQPMTQVEVKIISLDDGSTVPVGTIGEICCRGFNVMLGYYDNPEATASAIEADGWLHTGDLGTMDERGYIRVEGRLKDMVIRGGENLYPREIEELLFTHPAVADVAVLGIPDEKWGEELAAVVRRAPGHDSVTEQELRLFVRERLAPQKAPHRWAFLDELPLTPSGKVQKYVLRERFVKGEL